ncbi:MAG: hypothetical protein HGA38_04725 [Candidatus Moranbacteria bacterium]|nr:hypothetical protein [Candidatus Moranbacteria bacterium]
MKLELKMPKTDPEDILPFLARNSRWLFIVLFIVAALFGVWEWYRNVCKGDWSEEEKLRYAEKAFRETEFREQAFDDAVLSIRDMAASHEREADAQRDLFLVLPGSERQDR